MSELLFPVREAFSVYMRRWFDGLFVDTDSVREYSEREFSKAVMWAPGRMVDSVEDMLKTYIKNNTNGVPGENAKFPIVILAMAKDYTPSSGETGVRQMSRQLITLSEEEGASVYGYRQAHGDVRIQIVVMGAEAATAGSLAAQIAHFVGEIRNRRFRVPYTWGQYEFDMPCMLELPDPIFSAAQPDNQNMTILVGDLTLKVTLPMLDAPKPGEENDGTTNNPPGYPVITQVEMTNETTDNSVLVLEPVDKAALTDALDAASVLVEEDYTPETWAPLQEAIAYGNGQNDDPEAPQRLINIAARGIQEAIAALIERADKTALDDALAAAAGLTESDYTPTSWAALQTAVTAGIAVSANLNASQQSVDMATTAIETAMAALVPA